MNSVTISDAEEVAWMKLRPEGIKLENHMIVN